MGMIRERKEIEKTETRSRSFRESVAEKKKKYHELVKSDVEILKKGCKLLKIPHRGQPKNTMCFINANDNGDYVCYWSSKTKSRSQCTFLLRDCGLYLGQGQGLFKKRNLIMEPEAADSKAHSRLSFSLITDKRTVDMVAPDGEIFERW